MSLVDLLSEDLEEERGIPEIIKPHQREIARRVLRFLDELEDLLAAHLAHAETPRIVDLFDAEDVCPRRDDPLEIGPEDRVAEDDQRGLAGVRDAPRQIDRVADPQTLLLDDELGLEVLVLLLHVLLG